MQKKCAMCGEVKYVEDFRKYKHKIQGMVYNSYDSYCIDCRRFYDKQWKRIKREAEKERREKNEL